MAYDYKKENKQFYNPTPTPTIIKIPKMNFVAVTGKGNPNQIDGEYKKAMEILYAISFTLKMSYMGNYKIKDYFKYVVPPLEGLWWMKDTNSIDFTKKEQFNWISLIRLPDFITEKNFSWAIIEATEKKKKDFTKAQYFTYDEGLCVQCMHIGSYDNEAVTIKKLEDFAISQGYKIDINKERLHHEIYLSDPRKTKVESLKTIIRIPIIK